MKVLQIINSLATGGAEKLLLETIPLYRKAGIDMDLMVFWDNDFPFLQRLKDLDTGCKIYILKKSMNVKDIYSPAHIPKIKKIIKDYDVLHVHLFPAQYFVPLANIGLNKKIVFTEHSIFNKRIQKKIIRPLERWSYNRFDLIIAISDELRNLFFKKYLNFDENSITIQNGINLNTIFNAKGIERKEIRKEIKNEDILIIQVASFIKAKDPDTLIRAIKLLPSEYKLLLVGVGEREEEVKALVADLSLQDRVFFLGQRMDVPQLLKSCDIVVLSSHFEGLSLSSVEGLASGKPFIASDVPGLHEIVKDAGLLFKEGNEKELAQLIKEVSENENLREELMISGIQRAKQFDIQIMIDKHITLYNQLYARR